MTTEDNRSGEAGFTLVEVLAATAILTVVMLATLQVLDVTVRGAARDNARVDALRESRVGLDRMVRELRHAPAIGSASSGERLVATVRRRGVTTDVTLDCGASSVTTPGARRCVRTRGAVSETLIDGVRPGEPVFTYTPDDPGPSAARHVALRLRLGVGGGRSDGYAGDLFVEDGTVLRNAP